METKEKDSKKQEESTDKKVESKVEEKPDKADEKSKEEPETKEDGTSKLAQDLDALKGVVSGKDKKLKTVEEQLSETNSRLQKIENQSKVKDLLLESELPEAVKTILKKDIEQLTPETFESEAEKYISLYNQGVEEQKAKVADFVSKKPNPSIPEDFQERLSKVKSQEELDELLEDAD